MPRCPSNLPFPLPPIAQTRGEGATCGTLSALACGIERGMLVSAEEKVDGAFLADSVVVERWVRIQREQRLGVLVPYGFEGCQLPRESGVVADGKRRADVVEDELRGKIFFFGVAA